MLTEKEKQAIRDEVDRRLTVMLTAAIQEEIDEDERVILYGTGGEVPKGVIRVKAKP